MTTENYQDIEIEGKKGYHECPERWDIIKSHIKKGNSVIDIGSNRGYFSIKIAKEIENSVIWSIESNKELAFEQREIIKKNALYNIALSQWQLRLIDLMRLVRTTEGIDVILSLATFHYFLKEDLVEILYLCSRLAPKLIVEFPPIEEEKVANYDMVKTISPFNNYLKKFYESVEQIGECKATTNSKIKRPIYLARNRVIKRANLASYIYGETPKKHKIKYDAGWKIDNKKKWMPGFNCSNLMLFHPIYPDADWFIKNSISEYEKVIKNNKYITDVNIWNLLFAANGLKAIDYKEMNDDIYGMTTDEFKRRFQEYWGLAKEALIRTFKAKIYD